MKSILSAVTFSVAVLAITFGLSGFAGMNAIAPAPASSHASFIFNTNPGPQN